MMKAPKPYETVKVSSSELAKVYKVAKEQLDAIWPQYYEWASLRDERRRVKEEAAYEKRKAEYDREIAEATKRSEGREQAFKRALAAWENGPMFFRGPRPQREWVMEAARFRLPPMPPGICYDERIIAEDLRNHVETMHAHATAGQHEFELTEFQFAQMLAWREGRVVAGIRKRMAEESTGA